jgi:hypothetical protein
MTTINDQSYKKVVNLDHRNINSLSLISYANDFAKSLDFSEYDRLKMINSMVISIDFEAILAIFKHYFSDYSTVSYS